MHLINRPHTPDEATAEFIFRAYLLLKNAPPTFDKWARQGAFENIAACAMSWRVVGISEDALRKIAATGGRTDLQRGHWFARDRRYEALFGATAPTMKRDDLIRFFFDHDTTVVITKAQNNAGGDHTTWGKIIAVPEGMFTTRGYGFNVRKRTEIPWVATKVAELDQNEPEAPPVAHVVASQPAQAEEPLMAVNQPPNDALFDEHFKQRLGPVLAVHYSALLAQLQAVCESPQGLAVGLRVYYTNTNGRDLRVGWDINKAVLLVIDKTEGEFFGFTRAPGADLPTGLLLRETSQGRFRRYQAGGAKFVSNVGELLRATLVWASARYAA